MQALKNFIEFLSTYPLFIKITVPLLLAVIVILLILFNPKYKLKSQTDSFFNKVDENIKKSNNESELIDALEPLFLLPEFNENNNINWEEFSYTIAKVRLIITETIPKFKRNASIKNAFRIVNGFLMELEGNAEKVFGHEFSMQSHINKYINSRNEFINNLPSRKSDTRKVQSGSKKYTYSDYEAEQSKEVLKKLKYVVANIFKWELKDKLLEIPNNDYSAPPHFSSIWDEAAYSSNIREYESIRLFGLRWIGDGSYVIEEEKKIFPASIILKDKDKITSTYGHDCVIGFDLELKNSYEWAKIEKLFIKVKSFRQLKKYELMLPNPFEESNIYYVVIDDPKKAGKSEFEADLIYSLDGKVNKFNSIRLFPNKPESFAIRIDAKSVGLYTFDMYCILNTKVKKEIVCIFKDAKYAFVKDDV